MTRTQRKSRKAYGVRLLLSPHPEVRKLKRSISPSAHGNKLWNSSWLLMDFLHRRGLPQGVRVMELGCGWGLLGIYCAKKFAARVTCVDMDPEVFPFLHLHADVNQVEISTMRKSFDGLRSKHLREVDVMLGSDICFWDEMVKPLKNLLLRALRSGVPLVLLADPGRPPFEEVAEYFVTRRDGKLQEWTAQRPRRSEGRILRIGNIENLRL